jgi:hypothetical protein
MTITDIIPAAGVTGSAGEEDERRRAAYVSGLRALADTLEARPDEVPLPFDGRLGPVTIHFLSGDDPRAAMDTAARALGCPSWDKKTRDYSGSGGSAYFDLAGDLHGLKVRLTAYRDDVRGQAGAGTEDVTETAGIPEKTAAAAPAAGETVT